MDDRECLDRLDAITEDRADLFEHFKQRTAAGRTYYALPTTRHGIERGTVVVPDADAIVRGYPSIPRMLVLEPGLPSYFEDTDAVVLEEKLDGYNVRIADVGEPLAFTRGGYVCPYTTARARELLDPGSFFADYPKKMLCAELIGPETPYTTHDYDDIDSHAVRVFDIRDRESGEPVPVTNRRDLCAKYGFSQPRIFGWAEPEDAIERVRDPIIELDAANREGLVLKAAEGDAMVKYTTGSQHHDELADAFSLPFDHARDFLFSRVVREAFQAAEFEDDDDRLRERARNLGEAILLPMVETIRDIADGETVGERQTVRGRPEVIDALLVHLRDQSLTLEVENDRREDGERVIEFVKVAESTRDRTQYVLEGGTIDE